jgi:hypothetical protein
MVDFDKFEKNVKDNYGNQQFPFDEANWEKAAQLIDASRKGKNRGGIFLLSAVALLCTSGLVYYFGFSDSTSSLKNNNITVNQSVTENKNANNDNSASTITENNTTSLENTTQSEISSNIKEDVNNTQTETLNTRNTTSSKNNNSPNTINTPEKSSELKTVNENKTSPSDEIKSEEKTTSNSSSTNSGNATNSNHSSKQKNTQPIKSGETKGSTPPVLGSSNSTQAPKNTAVSSTNNDVVANSNRSGNLSNETQSTSSSTSITPTGVTPSTKPSEVTDSVPPVVNENVKIVAGNIDSLPKMTKGRADSLAAMMPKGEGVSYATNVKVDHNAKNILFMEAGTTYLLGWHGGGKTEAGGFNVLAGLNFQHYFTGNIAAQIGVQYSTIDNLTNSTHTISTVKYDLGVEQDVTSIRYQKLHYLVAPIKLAFNFKENNIFTVGCNIGYLLNSDSKKEKYKTYSDDPNATKNNLTSTKETGYVKGFSPYDIQVGVGYRRRIYKGLSANAEFFYGLTDTKQNSFFKSNSFDRNTGFKVTLCYDLFKK